MRPPDARRCAVFPLTCRSRRLLLLSLPLAGLLVLPGGRGAARSLPAAAASSAAAAEPNLRVLLAQANALELAAAGGPLQLRDGAGQPRFTLSPGQRLQLRLEAGVLRGQLLAPGAPAQLVALGVGELWVDPSPPRPQAPVPRAAAPWQADALASDGNPLLELQQRRFRGRLQLRPWQGQLQAINHVGLETYLASVVGSEMPASWPQAALRAQAVAARTYALSQRRPAAPYDVKATVASQMYKGVEAETPATREAVAATRTQVLVYGSNLIQAVFHSSGGGATENSGDLWNQQLPYLVSVPDYDQAGPVARWEQRFDGAELRRLFPELGGVTAVQVLASTSSGRVRQVRLQGPAGSLVLAGQELRSRLKLRSTLVQFRFELPSLTALTPAPTPSLGQPPLSLTPLAPGAVDSQATPSAGLAALPPLPALDSPPVPLPAEKLQPVLVVSGRGFGHGVGMSQWGAYAMALAGEDYTRILSHYYRGTALRPYPLP